MQVLDVGGVGVGAVGLGGGVGFGFDTGGEGFCVTVFGGTYGVCGCWVVCTHRAIAARVFGPTAP